MSKISIHRGTIDTMSAADMYGVLYVRSQVFSGDQEIAEADVDDTVAMSETIHMWGECDGRTVVALRIYQDSPHTHAIGRVATLSQYRGKGYAGELIRAAIQECTAPTINLGAQAHLEKWYESFGFQRSGEMYLDAKIEHVPMSYTP